MRQINGFGGILILFGVWWLMREFGLVPNEIGLMVLLYWPFALIFIGVLEVIRGNLSSAFFWILIGSLFQMSRVFNTNVWEILWPSLLIWFGLNMVIGRKPSSKMFKEERNDSKLKETVLFGPLEMKVNSKEFAGGTVECIFGGGKLDLSDVVVMDGSKLEVTAVFGGIEVIAPKKAVVEVRGTSVMGGFSNKVTARESKLPKLIITGTAIFGGVEVKD